MYETKVDHNHIKGQLQLVFNTETLYITFLTRHREQSNRGYIHEPDHKQMIAFAAVFCL